MKKIISILTLIFVSNSFSQNAKLVNVEGFKKEISNKSVQLIDVRTPNEFNFGHINNAININFNDPNFKTNIEILDKNKTVYLYCQAGGRSAKASKNLINSGFKKVVELEGGYNLWR
jgi:rhodanese-related sulfurtransferase